jgi:class 3 adenylate cyclase/tetratricopeptide (TPR) repeat protein
MDVGQWLRSLGLERYEAAFRDNDVDAALLPHLTPDDLKEMGVASVGHRRRMLAAVAAMRPDRAVGSHNLGTDTELRPLTVMFCDLVGYTSLSSRLDPEDLRHVILAYQTSVASIIEEFGGYITRYVGDGVLTYFGWPEAHETDAERAVRAGLVIATTVGTTPQGGETVQVRIGIATGLVILGESINAGEAGQQTAIGQTPNIAARLQSLAEPNQVMIDAATHRQIGRLFECEPLGPVELKGLPAAVPAWRVLGEGTVESRFEAFRGSTGAQMIGREDEFALLVRRWQQAKSGQGRIVLLEGEPGIGKSRLLVELEQRLVAESHTSLRYFCSPLHQGSGLHPVIARWQHDASFVAGDTVEQKLGKLRSLIADHDVSPADIALIANMLGLPYGDTGKQPDIGPLRRKEQTFALLLRLIGDRARRQPLLMLFEDVHWADHSSLELFEALIGLIPDLPILLVVSFRPEFVPAWVDRPGVSKITLARLDRTQSTALAAQMVTEHALTDAVMKRVIAQTDGVPLFIEELTKMLLDTGGVGAKSDVAVPSTLQASLIARLDRLPVAKQVAQTGAVIGRGFPHVLLAAASELPEAQLLRGLEELVSAGLVFRQGTAPDATYTFKHALVQDAAYSMITRERRRALHSGVAVAMEALPPDSPVAQAQLLAHHWSQAGEPRRAVQWWLQGARQTLDKLAPVEALVQTERGLADLRELPDDEWRWQNEVALQLVAGNALMVTHGHAAAATGAALARAVELCERLPLPKLRMDAQFGLWSHLTLRGDLSRAMEQADNMLAAENRIDHPGWQLAGLRAKGITAFFFGHFGLSVDVLQQFLDLWEGGQTTDGIGLAHDPGCISVHCYRSYSLTHVGRVAEARHHVAAAMQGARASGHHLIIAQAMFTEASLEYYIGAHETARQMLLQTHLYSLEHGVIYFRMFAAAYLGTIEGREGDLETAMKRSGEAIGIARASGTNGYLPGLLAREGELLTLAGRIPEALERFQEAIALTQQTSGNWDLAEIRRLFAKALIAAGDFKEAETQLYFAISIASEQGAWLYELDAAGDLAKMLSQSGRNAEARDLLRRCIGLFEHNEIIPILAEARGILDRLEHGHG